MTLFSSVRSLPLCALLLSQGLPSVSDASPTPPMAGPSITPGTRAAAAAPATTAMPPTASATAKAAGNPIYRGSTISYRNAFAALNLSPNTEPTYNPYYAMQLSLAPRVWFNDKVYARGSFDIVSELTQSDSTMDRFVIGDVGLAVGADGIYTIPKLNIVVSPELSISLPTSMASQATTRVMTSALSVSLARKFGAFGLSYSGNVEKHWNQFITGYPTASLRRICEVNFGTGCIDMFVQSGRRNINWSMTHGLSASYKVNGWLSFSAGTGVITAFLYDLPEVDLISLEPVQTANERYLMFTSVAASFKPTDILTVGLGARAVNGQLAPDGSFRFPLLNRFTQIYLDLSLNVAGLVSKLRS